MISYLKIPLAFLAIGSLLGVFLRWQFVWPTPGVNYSFLLHGHSHIMFLGWAFNALYLAFVINHIPREKLKFYKLLFIILQLLTAGMLISFPLQGYGVVSIILSSVHTVGAILFGVRFIQCVKSDTGIATWFAKVSIACFIVSTAGPFSLGYLMAHGLGQSNWYYFAIYFYLHFQYNGFFVFGILSLFFKLLERNGIQYDVKQTKLFGWILFFTFIPTYLLSILWAKPGVIFNLIAGIAGLAQLVAFMLFVRIAWKSNHKLRMHLRDGSSSFLGVILVAFGIKVILQLFSALPSVAQMAYELRPVVIAYLHLVLLGIVTLFLFVWYQEQNILRRSSSTIILVFLIAFLLMEFALVFNPWWTSIFGKNFPGAPSVLLTTAAILALTCWLILFKFSRRRQS